MIIVFTSMIILLLDTLPAVREAGVGGLNYTMVPDYDTTSYFYHNTLPMPELVYLDFALCVILLVEYMLRLISCPNKLHFLKRLENTLFAISLFPIMITTGLQFIKHDRNKFIHGDDFDTFIDVTQTLRVLRVMCLFRYGQYFPDVRVVLVTIRNSGRLICLVCFSLLVLSLFYGTLLFHAELHRGTIPTIALGVWWAFVTMTTVGYGDFYPTSALGYVIGSLCAVSGLIIITLPIAVIGINFNRYEAAMLRINRRKKYKVAKQGI